MEVPDFVPYPLFGVEDRTSSPTAQTSGFMDEGVQPQNSYRVQLDADGNLVWITQTNGREVRYHSEPETSFGQRFMSRFIQLLPVEHQL